MANRREIDSGVVVVLSAFLGFTVGLVLLLGGPVVFCVWDLWVSASSTFTTCFSSVGSLKVEVASRWI